MHSVLRSNGYGQLRAGRHADSASYTMSPPAHPAGCTLHEVSTETFLLLPVMQPGRIVDTGRQTAVESARRRRQELTTASRTQAIAGHGLNVASDIRHGPDGHGGLEYRQPKVRPDKPMLPCGWPLMGQRRTGARAIYVPNRIRLLPTRAAAQPTNRVAPSRLARVNSARALVWPCRSLPEA